MNKLITTIYKCLKQIRNVFIGLVFVAFLIAGISVICLIPYGLMYGIAYITEYNNNKPCDVRVEDINSRFQLEMIPLNPNNPNDRKFYQEARAKLEREKALPKTDLEKLQIQVLQEQLRLLENNEKHSE